MNLFDFFGLFFKDFVYLPQLNILQLMYNLTGDIGISIVILALVVNLLLWPLFATTYINGQKSRVLQPKIKEIQEKYKTEPQKLLKATQEFNKKHGINNSAIFLVLFGQILIASGLWTLTSDVSQGKEITGLYSWLFDSDKAQFSTTAFGFVQIGKQASEYIWLPLLNALLSFLYGMYSFRWAPKLDLSGIQKTDKKKDSKKDEPKPFDPEAMQKTLEFQTIYFMPIFLFLINFNLTVGVNIYFIAVSLLSLVRQVILTNYYHSHVGKLIEEIANSDPSSRDDDPSNNLEITADPAQMATNPQPTLVIDAQSSNLTKKPKNNKISKKKKLKK